jgi:hypothetical protein
MAIRGNAADSMKQITSHQKPAESQQNNNPAEQMPLGRARLQPGH